MSPRLVMVFPWVELWVTELTQDDHLEQLDMVINMRASGSTSRADRSRRRFQLLDDTWMLQAHGYLRTVLGSLLTNFASSIICSLV